jgi:NAD(P)-dependent dehydrogenase (short-subunit alcohol dehydrogenase family)
MPAALVTGASRGVGRGVAIALGVPDIDGRSPPVLTLADV